MVQVGVTMQEMKTACTKHSGSWLGESVWFRLGWPYPIRCADRPSKVASLQLSACILKT